MLSLLRLLTQQPQLLLEHADAYAELIGQEVKLASSIWRSALLYSALAIALIGTSGVLGGVAVMLWATIPAFPMRSLWVLWLVPAVPLILAFACMRQAEGCMQNSVFSDLRTQVAADITLLRDISAAA